LLRALNFDDVDPQTQYDASAWPALKRRFQSLFATQPLAHWSALLEGTDTCFAPVLNIAEAAAHPHNVARDLYRISPDGSITTRSAPRFLPLEGD